VEVTRRCNIAECRAVVHQTVAMSVHSSGSDWDGTGLCRFTKRLEQGVFLWPPDVHPGETPALTLEQLSMLIDGVDWRAPERRWRLTNRQCMARDHQFLVGRNNVKRNTAVGRRYA
jgi:transposase